MAYGDTGELPNLTTEEQAVEQIHQEAQDLKEIIFQLSDDKDRAALELSSGEEDNDANPSWGGIGE